MLPFFHVLSWLKGLRGTPFDIFGHTEERRTERALIREYEETIRVLLENLSRENLDQAVQLASIPEEIRGFGYIKAKSIVAARKKRDALLSAFGAKPAAQRAAA